MIEISEKLEKDLKVEGGLEIFKQSIERERKIMGNEGLKCKEKGLIVNMRENKKLEIERISEDRCNEEG